MATAMLTSERGLRRKIAQEEPPTRTRAPKRKSTPKKSTQQEQNNNVKRQRTTSDQDPKTDQLSVYQPWVIQTYGDLAKTKTITIKKYARILRTLRGEEVVSADNSKFRFWVKAKGFYVGKPPGYDAKPADAIVGRYSVCDMDTGIPSLGDKLTGSAKDPPLYVPNAPFKNSNGEPVYRKVAVVENFFDIIYNVHVELEGRPGKHAGQKRTYRTITETYAFLPREAVTRFLLGCTECQRRPRSPSPSAATVTASTPIQSIPAKASTQTPPSQQHHLHQQQQQQQKQHHHQQNQQQQQQPNGVSVLPTPSPSPTLQLPPATAPRALTDISPAAPPPSLPCAEAQPPLDYYGLPQDKDDIHQHEHDHEHERNGIVWNGTDITQSQTKIEQIPIPSKPRRSSNPLDVCNLTSRNSPSPTSTPQSPPKISTPPKKRHLNHLSEGNSQEKERPAPKLWSPIDGLTTASTDESRPSRGFSETEIDYSLPITTTYLKYMRSLGCTDHDAFKFEKTENTTTPEPSEAADEDQFTVGGRNGSEVPDLSSLGSGEDVASLWASYHSALGLAKGKATPPVPRDQSSPVLAETGSAHDETSSSGNKEDEDDDDDESDDRIDAQQYDPERLKAFNMFVRLFVDENLDRMVPISKQPKEKIQAIIDSCTRQFPEFAERARKRIRTYLKSCRRNKRARDPTAPWDATRPTPAHLTSVQAEQILATACENESHNAKRMRLGLEPVSQPMPVLPGATPTDTTASIGQPRSIDFPGGGTVKMETTDAAIGTFSSSTTPTSTATSKPLPINQDNKNNICVSTALTSTSMNGLGIANTTGAAPTAMYRPNFSQAFQRAGPYPALFPGQPFNATGGMLTNGPTDLSMKQKPLLSHKLSAGEMAAVRQLITGYRESAAFLLRSADELEQLLLQQQ